MAEARLSDQLSPLSSITAFGKAVGDPLRSGILQVLREDSFSVSELCSLFAVPQPALSHHLKILHQAGLVARRREGNSIFYRRAPGHPESGAGEALHGALYTALDNTPIDPERAEGINHIHANRADRCRDFFARHADDVAAQQTQIAEPRIYTDTVIDMVVRGSFEQSRPGTSKVLEVGPGDGRLLGWLAQRFDTVTGIDNSAAMLARAAASTNEHANIELIEGDFLRHHGNRYDLIVAAMVIHHLPSPAHFFQHATRLLTGSGALIVAELCRHEQQWTSELCGDLWLGFEPAELVRWAHNAGFTHTQSQFLAQKNGFQIQLQQFVANAPQPPNNLANNLANTPEEKS